MATLDGRAYYILSKLLKNLGVSFLNLKPIDEIPKDLILVLTTEKEKDLVKHYNVICIEELGKDLKDAEAKLLNLIYGKEGRLVIGIDPGRRTGMVAFYKDIEVNKGVYDSQNKLIDDISRLIRKVGKEKVVRIGDGDIKLATRIAEALKRKFRKLKVEIVDERGTSVNAKIRTHKRGTIDEESARMIAFREGKTYE